MRRLDWSHLVHKFLGGGSNAYDESTPLTIGNNSNGRPKRNKGMLETGEAKAPVPEKSVGDQPKMGVLRKLCFLLSFNGWVLYVAALLWWIPCRHPSCMSLQNWTVQLNGTLTTNIKMTESSIVFASSDVLGGSLSALWNSDGGLAWNRSPHNVLRNLFCDLRATSEGACIATAFNYVAAFNVSTGDLIWEQDLSDSDDVIIGRISSTGSTIFGIGGERLYSFDSRNGSLHSTVQLPCLWTLDVKIAGPWALENGTGWVIVCDFGDSLEVRTFYEEEVIDIPTQGNLRKDEMFKLLFSTEGEGTEPIGPTADVARNGDLLALSWTDRVVMVTRQATTGRLHKKWERIFPGKLVTGIVFGHFTDPRIVQLAVLVQDNLNATLYILEKQHGEKEAVKSLGPRSVVSMKNMTLGKDKTDALVIESVPRSNAMNLSMESTSREYSVLHFSGNQRGFEKSNVLMLDAYDSALSYLCDGVADLVVASRDIGGSTTLHRLVIAKGEERPYCRSRSVHVHVVD